MSSQILNDHIFLANLRCDKEDCEEQNEKSNLDGDDIDSDSSNDDNAHRATDPPMQGEKEKQSTAKDDAAVACAICLMDYRMGDEICFSHNRRCNHHFHADCLTEWLVEQKRVDCPCCRNNYLALSDDEEDSDSDNDVVGNVLARQTAVMTPSSIVRVDQDPTNTRYSHSENRSSIGRNQPTTRRTEARSLAQGSATGSTTGTMAATDSTRGEDPWTGVPLHFFDHQFSNVLRPYRNLASTASTIQVESSSRYLGDSQQQREQQPQQQQQEQHRGQRMSHEGMASFCSSNSSVYTEGASVQWDDIEQQRSAASNSEDETDMWSCGPATETENDSYFVEDDPVQNFMFRPGWSRPRRQRRSPTAIAPLSVQNSAAERLHSTESVSLELSDLIVEGLMQRLEEDNRVDDERSSRTVSSGSVYLQGTPDSDNDEEDRVAEIELSATRARCIEIAGGSSVGHCTKCGYEYTVNQELCGLQDLQFLNGLCQVCSFRRESDPLGSDVNNESDALLLQLLQQLERQVNRTEECETIANHASQGMAVSSSSGSFDDADERLHPGCETTLNEDCSVATVGDNSLGASIGSFTTTSEIIMEAAAVSTNRSFTLGTENAADTNAVVVANKNAPDARRNNLDALDTNIDLEADFPQDHESPLIQEWGLVIGAFARMNERILNSQMDHLVSTKRLPSSDEEGRGSACQDVGQGNLS